MTHYVPFLGNTPWMQNYMKSHSNGLNELHLEIANKGINYSVILF